MFYAVRTGKKPGVYETWEECAAQVLAFKGAAFKKFSSMEAATAYVFPLKCLQESAKSQTVGVKTADAPSLHSALASEVKHTVQTSTERISSSTDVIDTRRRVDSEISPSNGTKFSIYIYTDGCCLSNKDVANKVCPAGWGVVILNGLTMQIESELFAPVPVDEKSSLYLGAHVGSNNTAELTAIGEACRWLINNGDLATYPRVCIRYDSEYAAKSVQGIFNGAKNVDLITNIRRLFRQAAIGRVIVFEHVKGHSNEKFNSRADFLAKKGASGESCFTEHQPSFVTIAHKETVGGTDTEKNPNLTLKKRKRDEEGFLFV